MRSDRFIWHPIPCNVSCTLLGFPDGRQFEVCIECLYCATKLRVSIEPLSFDRPPILDLNSYGIVIQIGVMWSFISRWPKVSFGPLVPLSIWAESVNSPQVHKGCVNSWIVDIHLSEIVFALLRCRMTALSPKRTNE